MDANAINRPDRQRTFDNKARVTGNPPFVYCWQQALMVR